MYARAMPEMYAQIVSEHTQLYVASELCCSKQQKANSEKNDVESFKTNQFV